MSADVALVGLAGVGKSTVAAYLRSAHGYGEVAFAEPLRRMLYELNPIVAAPDYRMRPLVDAYGWDYVKRRHPEARRLLRDLGRSLTEVFDSRVLIREALAARATYAGPVVFSDVRTYAELATVRGLGAAVVLVNRAAARFDGHATEHLPTFPSLAPGATIDNDGTLGELRAAVDRIIQAVRSA